MFKCIFYSSGKKNRKILNTKFWVVSKPAVKIWNNLNQDWLSYKISKLIFMEQPVYFTIYGTTCIFYHLWNNRYILPFSGEKQNQERGTNYQDFGKY